MIRSPSWRYITTSHLTRREGASLVATHVLQHMVSGGANRLPLLLVTLVILFVGQFCATTALAQVSLDEVHVTPNSSSSRLPPTEVERLLHASTKPIKGNVDLVLVPVTVTDPMDRIVTGLDREDFEIRDGKESQEIRHFSREDAPVSLARSSARGRRSLSSWPLRTRKMNSFSLRLRTSRR
jgi:hypothetical protein